MFAFSMDFIFLKAGQERFRRSMVHHYYRNVNAVVFVYDVTNSHSFEVNI